MIKPNFFIIGAPKAATTSLSTLLEQHPEVAIVQSKEPHYFSFDNRYAAGWAAYLSLYSHVRDEKAVGDASTSYCRLRYHPHTIERIRQAVPEAKIIYMVRHPLERMESAYVEHMASEGGMVFTSVNDAVQRQPMILDSSRYWEVFDAYRNAFGEERVKVVWFEEYSVNTLMVYQDVCRFLGVDDSFAPDMQRQMSNSRTEARKRMEALGRGGVKLDTTWDPDLRRRVLDVLREDNLRFLRHFGKPDDHWGGIYTADGAPQP